MWTCTMRSRTLTARTNRGTTRRTSNDDVCGRRASTTGEKSRLPNPLLLHLRARTRRHSARTGRTHSAGATIFTDARAARSDGDAFDTMRGTASAFPGVRRGVATGFGVNAADVCSVVRRAVPKVRRASRSTPTTPSAFPAYSDPGLPNGLGRIRAIMLKNSCCVESST